MTRLSVLLAAWKSADVVCLGEDHDRYFDNELRIALARHPELANTVRAVVVEMANPVHQGLPWMPERGRRDASTACRRKVMASDGPILLIGGTRGTGLLIARVLLEQSLPVRVLARDPAQAARRLGAAEIIRGDITQPPTLAPAVADARHIIFTAGCRSGRPASPRRIRRTEYEGVLNTLAAGSHAGFAGRFLYMTASGSRRRSFWTLALNIYKGNTLAWRARAERSIHASGVSYTIVRTGMLTNAPGGQQGIRVTQAALPLSPRYRIPRADVASVFVASMEHPKTNRATFEIVSQRGGTPWLESLNDLEPDSPRQPRG